MSFFTRKRSKVTRYARTVVSAASAAEKVIVKPAYTSIRRIYAYNAGSATATIRVGSASAGTEYATQAVAAGAVYDLAPTVNGYAAAASNIYVSSAAISTADIKVVIEYVELPVADQAPSANPAGLNRG